MTLPPRARIDAVLREAVERGGVPGVVAAVTDPETTLYEGAFGHAGIETGRPVTVEHVFRIASMTKPFTSLAALALRDEGRLALDEPAARHRPELAALEVLASFDATSGAFTTRPAARPITARDLLTHTSGLGYWFLREELRRLMGPTPDHFNAPFLLHDPGERFTYGIGTDVLGRVLESLTGVDIERLLAARLFSPLSLRDTGFSRPADTERLAALHVRTGDGFLERPPEAAGEGPRGGGALYSSARDYLALLRLLLCRGRAGGTQIVALATIEELASNQIGALFADRQRTAFPPRTHDFAFLDGTQKFGFGVAIETADRPSRRRAGSYGWAGVFNTFFWVDPRAGIGAVLLTQSSPFCDPDTLGLLDAFERAVYRYLRP